MNNFINPVKENDIVIRSDETHRLIEVDDILAVLEAKGYSEGKDLAYFTINHSVRRELPYGIWTCSDGRKVLFNRDYQPLMQIKDNVRRYLDHNEQIDKDTIHEIQYLYNDITSLIRYIVKHLGRESLTAIETKRCKTSLLICLKVLREFTPKENYSVNSEFSITKRE